MALLRFLIPLFFVTFSLGELLRFRVYSSVSIGVIDIVLSLILFVWFLKIPKTKYKLKKPLLVFIGIGILSLILNITRFTHDQIMISSLYLVRFILYSSMYFVFRDVGEGFRDRIPKLAFLSATVVIIIGFLQYLLYPSLRNLYYLGWDEHLYRLFSTYLDPNFTGVILVLFFIFFFIKKDNLLKNKKITYLVLILNLIAIVLTYSRGALLMLLVSTLIYAVIKKSYKQLLIMILLFGAMFVILSPKFYIENTNLLRLASLGQRIETSKQAIVIYKDHPVLGIGFNTLRYAREQYGFKDLSRVGPSHSGAGVDNSLIFVLVTTGIVGLISYMFLLYKVFALGFEKIKTNKYCLILVVSLFGLLINSLLINSLFYSFIMVWVWILAGLTESSLRE